MITAAQLRAARALLGIEQKKLAEWSGVSLPTIQRMEASDGNVRGTIDTLTKVVEALDNAGVELIGEFTRSEGNGRGVRLRRAKSAQETGRLLALDSQQAQATASAAVASDEDNLQ